MNSYHIGDVVRVSAEFTDADGEYLDPTDVYFQAMKPDGTLAADYEYGVDAEIVRTAVGRFYCDVSVDTTGLWRRRWWSTGTGAAADEGKFLVKESAFS